MLEQALMGDKKGEQLIDLGYGDTVTEKMKVTAYPRL